MNIDEFIESKTIKVAEVEANFKLEKEIDMDFQAKECPNCGDKHNIYSHRSEPWTSFHRCIKCESVILVYIGDRMGGQIDTVRIFKDK